VPSLPDVTVCGWESLFVQITVSPTLTFTGLGENALVVLLEAPVVTLTAVFAAKAGENEADTSTAARTATKLTATVIFEFIVYEQYPMP